MADERARSMRKTLTPQEARLWARLKQLRSRGFHFRRQAPFRGYYLDFVCHRQRLVVEVDGGQHAAGSQKHRDVVRDKTLSREGFTTLRFWNNEINNNLDGVMDTIVGALGPPTPTASRSTLPTEGEG